MAQPNKQSLLHEVLGRALDSDVLVGVKGGQRFRGKLRTYDLHMNLVLWHSSRRSSDYSPLKVSSGDLTFSPYKQPPPKGLAGKVATNEDVPHLRLCGRNSTPE